MPERCKHDMIPDYCGDCTGRVGGIDPDLMPVERGKRVEFEGFCRHCNEDFVVGETLITQCSADSCTHRDKAWVCCIYAD